MTATQSATVPPKPQIVAPNVRDLGQLAREMESWLSGKMPDASAMQVTNLSYPIGAGMSHETILFDAAWKEGGEARQRGMVVRIKPTSKFVYQDDCFVQQYELMRLMHRTGAVPVATPLWFEDDPTLLGAPFFVMEKVHGRVCVTFPPYCMEGWLFDSTPDQRAILWEDSVRKLAGIQTVPIADAPFLNIPGTFAEPFDQEIDRFTRYLDWVDPAREQSLLRQGFDRLLAARPKNRPEGIVWGDSRLGNMMVGDDYKVVAVMDWEQPSVGGALHDLGWWLAIEEMQTTARGIAPLDGMGTTAQTIALWEEVSGKSAADWQWYEAFAIFKLDAISVKMMLNGALKGRGLADIVFGERTKAGLAKYPDIFP